MKINYNEGGKWFTFWLDTQGETVFRVWFGPMVKGFVLFSISFAIYNPWLSEKRAEKFAKELYDLIDWKKAKERAEEYHKKHDV